MTKFKTFTYGPYSFKTYFKPVGKGYEVGFTYKGRTYFMGNFVHKTEATQWWSHFTKQIQSFSKKNMYSPTMPFTWYCTFMANHLYKEYYTWLDKVFYRHEGTFKKAYNKDYRRYQQFKKNLPPGEKTYYSHAA